MNENTITVPENIPTTILPPDFVTVAVPRMQAIHKGVEAIVAEVRTLEIKDHESRTKAGLLNTQLKGESKSAEATMTPYTLAADRVVKFLREMRQRTTNLCEQGKGILVEKMGRYDREEEQKAAAEKKRQQDIIDAENKRIADEKLKADQAAAAELRRQKVLDARRRLAAKDITKAEYARLLKEAGEEAEASKAQAEADAEYAKEHPPQVSVRPNTPKVAGNIRRVNYSAECVDVDKFLLAFINSYGKDKELHLRLRECIVVSNQKLSEKARGLIKTRPDDDRHELTVDQFQSRYPFVKVMEDRSY